MTLSAFQPLDNEQIVAHLFGVIEVQVPLGMESRCPVFGRGRYPISMLVFMTAVWFGEYFSEYKRAARTVAKMSSEQEKTPSDLLLPVCTRH